MIDRFDHLVIATRDLDTAAEQYRAWLGFDVRPGGRHTGRGTHNALVRFGLDYLELIAVYDEAEATAASRDSLVQFIRRHPGGLVAYALATTDIEADAARLASSGLAAVGPFAMQRRRPDGSILSWRLLVPGGDQYRRPWPFLIQWDGPDDERLALDAIGRHPNGVRAVREIGVVVADLDRGLDLYSRHLGLTLAGRDAASGLGADRAIFHVGTSECFQIALLAPTGPGVVADALAAMDEGPFHAVLSVDDLEQSRTTLAALGTATRPSAPEGVLIDPDRTLGFRFILTPG